MKIAAAFVVLTHATEEPDQINCWPANDNAPHCGCQWITREHNMIGNKCELDFHNEVVDVDAIAMLTIASSFPFPRETDLDENQYFWTGFQGLSHENLHDIVWFFRPEICPYTKNETTGVWLDRNGDPARIDLDSFMAGENFDLYSEPLDEGFLNDSLPLLGNFNYDIARSHQSYNLPIYGLQADQTAVINIDSHNIVQEFPNDVRVRNVTAHHGHGVTSGDGDSDGPMCDEEFFFTLTDHLGELEYVNFYLCEDPTVSGEASPGDYRYDVPSSWTSTISIRSN